MPRAERTIVIDRPREAVFTFFTDPANETSWRTHVKEISAEGPPSVGGRIHQVVAGPGGRGIPADLAITAYTPPEVYAFRVTAGPVRPEGEYRFVAAGESTEVTLSLAAELSGVKKLLLSRAVQRSMDGEMGALDRAKAILEAR